MQKQEGGIYLPPLLSADHKLRNGGSSVDCQLKMGHPLTPTQKSCFLHFDLLNYGGKLTLLCADHRQRGQYAKKTYLRSLLIRWLDVIL